MSDEAFPHHVFLTHNSFSLEAKLVGWITVALLWTAAVYSLFQMRSARLTSVISPNPG